MGILEGVGIGDIHLDKVERLLPGIGNKWVQREMRKPLDYALENGLEHVIYYGDIFEHPRASYESQSLFKRVIFAKKYRNLHQWIIIGNHDYDEKGRNSWSFC
jgi:metallophosphoesterase superfamily enzyme